MIRRSASRLSDELLMYLAFLAATLFGAWAGYTLRSAEARAAVQRGLVCPAGCEVDVAPLAGSRLRAMCWCDTPGGAAP